MADNTASKEYEKIATGFNNNLPGILSGAQDALKNSKFEEGLDERVKSNREATRDQSVESFNPVIDRNWTYPGYKEDKKVVEDKKKVYKESEKDLKQQVKDVEDDYKEKKEEVKEDIKNKKKTALETILEKSSERQTEEAKNKQGKKVEDYKAKEQEYLKKSNKAKTWTGANIYMDLARMQKDLANKEAQKEVPIKKANLLNLSKEEREAVLNNDKSLAKEKLETVKKLNEEMANSIGVLKGSEEYKAAEQALEVNKEAYQKARKELNKKQAPYAIRNAFLIIDAIYKTFRNIGRAMPQVQNSPSYTKTPEEVPELFKLWSNQIGKSMEREQKTEETLADIINKNTEELYSTPKGLQKDLINRNMTWNDKLREFQLSQQGQLVAEETLRKLEDMRANMTEEEKMNLAIAASLSKVKSGDKSYSDHKISEYIINNADTVEKMKRWLKVGATAKDVLKGALEEVKDSLFLNVATMGTSGVIISGLVGALDALPNIDDDDKFRELAVDLRSLGTDMTTFFDNVMKLIDAKKDKSRAKKIDKLEKEIDSKTDELSLKEEAFYERYPDYQPKTGGAMSTSSTVNSRADSEYRTIEKLRAEIDKKQNELNKIYPIKDLVNSIKTDEEKPNGGTK